MREKQHNSVYGTCTFKANAHSEIKNIDSEYNSMDIEEHSQKGFVLHRDHCALR